MLRSWFGLGGYRMESKLEWTRERIEGVGKDWEGEGILNGRIEGTDPKTGIRMVGRYRNGRRVGVWTFKNSDSNESLTIRYLSSWAPISRAAVALCSAPLLALRWIIRSALDMIAAMMKLHPILSTVLMLSVGIAAEGEIRRIYRQAKQRGSTKVMSKARTFEKGRRGVSSKVSSPEGNALLGLETAENE